MIWIKVLLMAGLLQTLGIDQALGSPVPIPALRAHVSQLKFNSDPNSRNQALGQMLKATGDIIKKVQGIPQARLESEVTRILSGYGNILPGLSNAPSFEQIREDFIQARTHASHNPEFDCMMRHVSKNVRTRSDTAYLTLKQIDELGPELDQEFFEMWQSNVVDGAVIEELRLRWLDTYAPQLTCWGAFES